MNVCAIEMIPTLVHVCIDTCVLKADSFEDAGESLYIVRAHTYTHQVTKIVDASQVSCFAL